VRLKITKRLSGSIDGLHVGRFRAGEIYEIGTSLANYLLAINAAEPVSDTQPPDSLLIAPDGVLDELNSRPHHERKAAPRTGNRRLRPGKRRKPQAM
jgi:hypothetical protein